jgi:hypothetical protein
METGKRILAAAAVFALASSSANAAIIIDPGNVGDSFASRSVTFDDLNNISFAGQVLELHFVFDAMKHIEITGAPSPFDWYYIDVSLMHTPSGNDTAVVAFPPDEDLYLSDENGDPVLGYDAWLQNSPGATVGFRLYFSPSVGLVYHDIHASIALPSTGETITGGAITWLDTGYTNGVGGSAVPEPTTLALFGLGLAGLGAMWRKKLAA